MEIISIKDIIDWAGGSIISGDTEINIKSVCIDTRNLKPDCLFIAIKGANTDGHDFIMHAFQNGASACIIDKPYSVPYTTNGTIICVNDTVAALQAIAGGYRRRFSIPVIGVTGSVGKSTTKEMIASALQRELDVLKTEGNHNGQLGLPLTLLNLESHHKVAVVEMGISEFGEMDRIARVANPDIGVVTNIGMSHIENFKTPENIREEKLKILSHCEGKYYLNGDSPLLSNINKDRFKNVTYFGLNGAYPYSAEDISSKGESTEFVLVTPRFRESILIPCLGIHNVYNALAAIAVAIDMGIHLDDIKSGLLEYKGLSMRQQIMDINGVKVIDDSYNASPDSVKSSVSVLRALRSFGKNIVVISDMLELGEHSPDMHYEIGKYMAVEGIDILITVGNLSKFIYKGACDSSLPIKAVHCESNKEAAEEVLNSLNEGDKVLIKGSRGMHTEEIVSFIKEKILSDN